MIYSFKSKALKKFWEESEVKLLPSENIDRIDGILDALDQALVPEDMNIPGYNFHSLSGKSKGRYSVKVSSNYRITFAFEDGDAIKVDYEDYH